MDFADGLTVGIDLGTTFSTLAYLDENGTPIPVENDDGDCETPSLILLASNGHVVVGPNRMRAAMEPPKNVVDRVKRHMGETQGEYDHEFDGKKITPEFLSALILKKLRQDAEKKLGIKIGNAVITVPYYFNDARRKATQDAGRIAGLNVIDIVNEPTAATLTFAWMHHELGVSETGSEKPKLVLVYDLGGGTFDVTVVRFTPTHFQVLSTDGDVHLGGVDWNDRLLAHVAELFKEEHGKDFRESPEAVQLMLYECDQAKIALSENDKTIIACRHQGKTMTIQITRDQFEEMTADLTQRTIDTAELVMEQATIKPDDLDAVVLVGGSTLMPVIVDRIEKVFNVKANRDLSPHTAVAQGAALHAAILEAKHRGKDCEMADKLKKSLSRVSQEDVNSHGLGMVVHDPSSSKQINYVMVPRNTKLPAEGRHTFVTKQEGQTRVHVKVIQGEAPDPSACSQVGDLYIHDLPEGLPKGAPVEVIYSFDEMGRIHVRAEDKTSGKSAKTQIERSGALDDGQLDALTRLATDYKVD
ncbi:MAG: Hsp70 family protein [Pirellulales bacterium]